MADVEAALPAEPVAVGAIDAFGYKQELRRSLSMVDLLVYGLVFIVPIAPFSTFGFVFNASKGMVPLVYGVGLVAMLFTALSYMTMSRAFPVAGSVYAYASRGIGQNIGFLAGWALLLDYLLLPTLIYILCAISVHAVIPGVPEWVWVVVFLGFNTAVNLFGIEATSNLNKILLLLQLGLLGTFMVLGVVALSHHVGGAHLSITPLFAASRISPGLIFGALSLAALSFLGFDAVSTLSEESKGGASAVGAATMWSLCLAGVLFVAQTYLASLFVLDRTAFAAGDEANTAFLSIAKVVGGGWFKWSVSILGVVFSGLAGALTAQAATARLLFSMARDGKMPRPLARVHPGRQTPDVAILTVAAITLVLGVGLVSKVELLTSMVNFGALTGFLMLHVSVLVWFVFRQKSRRLIRHLVVPLIGLGVIGYVLFNAQVDAKIAGVVWMTVGGAVLLFLKLTGRSVTLPVDEVSGEGA